MRTGPRARSARDLDRPPPAPGEDRFAIDPDAALAWQAYANAVVVPTASRTVYRNIAGAVFDAARRPVEGAFLTRTWIDGQITRPPDPATIGPDLDLIDRRCLYGGYLFDQFGHFILESLARTWAVHDLGDLPIVWAAGAPPNSWQAQILEIVGIRSEHIFPARPTRVRELIVPAPGFRLAAQYHPDLLRHLGRYRPAASAAAELSNMKVWLSRSGAPAERRSAQEAEIEAVLLAKGWRIVHSQEHSMVRQLDILGVAGIVAGLESSAFHAALLLREPAAKFIVMRQTLNRTYGAIADAKGIIELDLFGAYLIDDRFSRALAHPASTALLVDKVAVELLAGEAPPAATKRFYEDEFSYENWQRRQRFLLLAHFRSRMAHRLRMHPRLARLFAPRG